jgi:hypothetical protein
MANTVAPFGFRPIRRVDGAAYSGQFDVLKAQPTVGALNRGDMVSRLADGTVQASAAADGHIVTGVYIGCHYLSAALGYPIWSNYWPGSGALGAAPIDVFVITDPFVVYEVQAAAGPFTQADIGATCDIVVTASTTGFSKWALAAAGVAATTPWRIIRLGNGGVNISDGYDATSANNIVEVSWNSMFMLPGAGV